MLDGEFESRMTKRSETILSQTGNSAFLIFDQNLSELIAAIENYIG